MQKIISVGALIILSGLFIVNADARSMRLNADLNGGNEVVDTTVNRLDTPNGPVDVTLPVKGLLSGAYGEAHFTLSPDGNSLSYTLQVSKTSTAVFMAHIHIGPPTQNGPIMLWLFGDPTHNPIPNLTLPRTDPPFADGGTGGGTVSGTLTAASFPTGNTGLANLGVTSFADAAANILKGNAYVNVHTVRYPPGEIRGQIMRNQLSGGNLFDD